VSTVIKSF